MQQLNNTKQQCTTIHNTSQQPLHNDALNNDARNQWRVKSQQWPERDGEEEQKKYAKQWTDKNQITSNRPKKTATTTMHSAAKHIKMKHKSALHRNKMFWILIKKRQNTKARSVQCNTPVTNVLKQWWIWMASVGLPNLLYLCIVQCTLWELVLFSLRFLFVHLL